MRKDNTILIVNWGTQDKEYVFDVAKKKRLKIYLATSKNYPKWVEKYVTKSNLIITNTYDSERLIIDVLSYMERMEVSFDGVTTFFEMNIVQTADLASALSLTFLNPGAARRSSANKLLMRMMTNKLGVSNPKFASFRGLSDGLRVLKKFKSPSIIKPLRSGHSYGVVEVGGESREKFKQDMIRKYSFAKSQLSQNYDEWMQYWKYKSDFLIEEYVGGRMISVDGLIQDSKFLFIGMAEYEMSSKPLFLQQATFIPARISRKQVQECIKVAKKIIKGLAFDYGGFHCEMKIYRGKCYLIEVAGRLPGGQMLLGYKEVYGVDLADLYFDVCLGRKVKVVSKKIRSKVLQETVPMKLEGKVVKVRGLKELNNMSEFKVFSRARVGDRVRSVKGVFNPAIYYQLSAKTDESLEEKRLKVRQSFEVEIKTIPPVCGLITRLTLVRDRLYRISPVVVKKYLFNTGLIKGLINFLNKANAIFSNDKR